MPSSQPIRRTLRWRSAAITVELPARLRRLRPRAGRPDDLFGANGLLEIIDDRVELAVDKANPGHYVRKDWGLNEKFVAAPERAFARADPEDLAASVAGRAWYHTIELSDGIVTPGLFDHRPLVPHYGLPRT